MKFLLKIKIVKIEIRKHRRDWLMVRLTFQGGMVDNTWMAMVSFDTWIPLPNFHHVHPQQDSPAKAVAFSSFQYKKRELRNQHRRHIQGYYMILPRLLGGNFRIAKNLGSIESLVCRDWFAPWSVGIAHDLFDPTKKDITTPQHSLLLPGKAMKQIWRFLPEYCLLLWRDP